MKVSRITIHLHKENPDPAKTCDYYYSIRKDGVRLVERNARHRVTFEKDWMADTAPLFEYINGHLVDYRENPDPDLDIRLFHQTKRVWDASLEMDDQLKKLLSLIHVDIE